MEKISENIIGKLIEINLDRRDNYQAASTYVDAKDKKKFLIELANESEGFVMELTYFLKLYGGSTQSLFAQHSEHHQKDYEFSRSDQAVFLILHQQEIKRIEHYNHLLIEAIDLDNALFDKIRSQKTALIESEEKLAEVMND